MMTMESLLAAYTAWALAWMAPLWLVSFLYRSLKRTIACSGAEEDTTGIIVLPARPAYLHSIHLTAA
jgi:hypothetical protein